MNTNPSKAEIDKENYKVDHGSMSLTPFLDLATSQLVVVKHHDADKVQVVDVDTLTERSIGPSEFQSGFCLCVQDDMVSYFGNKEQIDGATRLMESVERAVKYCIHGKNQALALANS